MKAGIIALVVLVLAAFLIGSSYVGARNEMVRKNEAVKSAWAQVDVVLERRSDLIPNLVETVKGFAAQEQTVFHDIAAARSALMGDSRRCCNRAAPVRWVWALGRLLV